MNRLIELLPIVLFLGIGLYVAENGDGYGVGLTVALFFLYSINSELSKIRESLEDKE